MSTSAIGMSQSLAARDAGMASSAEHAEQDAPGWGERAMDLLRGWVYGAPNHPFTIEEFRMAVTAYGFPQPPDLRAYGSLARRAIREKLIEPVGYAPAVSSNLSPKRTYRLVRAG